MLNIVMHMAYDGTRYAGFQRLGDNSLTVQERLETIISKLLGKEIKIIGASRTDAGVHALDQVVNFHVDTNMPVRDIMARLNQMLPDDIVVTDISLAKDTFHSRYYCEKKTYLYRIHTGDIPPLFERRYVYHLDNDPDLAKMRSASALFLGKHDFQGFCKRKMKKSTVRTIYELRIEAEGAEIRIYITADGFLYNMVRIIAGTLIEIGLGKRDAHSVSEILENQTRSEAGYLVPPTGLVLYKNYITDKKKEDKDDEY